MNKFYVYILDSKKFYLYLNFKLLISLEKAAYIKNLNEESCFSIRNGNNDALMLEKSTISIALIGDEECSTKALLNSTIVCKNIVDALDLLLNKNRLIATLRK